MGERGGQHTKGCGEEASPLFRGHSPPQAGALGAEPLGKCCVPGDRLVKLFQGHNTRMGRLSGFTYREVSRKLRKLGFAFDRQAAGSHEIWFNADTLRYTTLPNHPGALPEGTLRAILQQAGVAPARFLRA